MVAVNLLFKHESSTTYRPVFQHDGFGDPSLFEAPKRRSGPPEQSPDLKGAVSDQPSAGRRGSAHGPTAVADDDHLAEDSAFRLPDNDRPREVARLKPIVGVPLKVRVDRSPERHRREVSMDCASFARRSAISAGLQPGSRKPLPGSSSTNVRAMPWLHWSRRCTLTCTFVPALRQSETRPDRTPAVSGNGNAGRLLALPDLPGLRGSPDPRGVSVCCPVRLNFPSW